MSPRPSDWSRAEPLVTAGQYARELRWLPVDMATDPKTVAETQRLLGSAGVTALLLQQLHHKRGVQLRVQRQVSDDLVRTDFVKLRFEEIPWPAASVEVFFEDPQLPTVLLGCTDGATLERLADIELVGDKKPRVMVAMESSAGAVHVLNLKDTHWQRVVNEGETVSMEAAGALSVEEDLVLREMTKLCLKVFAYAALPRYEPQEHVIVTRAMGGKAGWRGRPSRPVKRIVYLPAVHTARSTHPLLSAAGRTMPGHERRGFFRIYRHPKWRTMRGRWLYIAPTQVHGGRAGNGTPPVFVVR